nr:MAG TPA: hypothetical protein [Caudoviricetes sp.]
MRYIDRMELNNLTRKCESARNIRVRARGCK